MVQHAHHEHANIPVRLFLCQEKVTIPTEVGIQKTSWLDTVSRIWCGTGFNGMVLVFTIAVEKYEKRHE